MVTEFSLQYAEFFCASSGAPKVGLGLTPASQPAPAVTLGGLGASTTSSSGTGFAFGALPIQNAASTQQSTGGFSFPGAKVQAPAATSAQSAPSFSLGAQTTGELCIDTQMPLRYILRLRKLFVALFFFFLLLRQV